MNPSLPSTAGTANSYLVYGPSGSYKTTQVLALATHIWETTGLRTRVISAENAGAETLSPGIALGYIEPLWLGQELQPRSALRKLQRGMWPKMVDGIPQRVQKPGGGLGEILWEPLSVSGSEVGAYAFEGLTSISALLSQQLKAKFASGASVTGSKSEGTGLAGAGYSEEGETFGSGSQSQVGSVQDAIMELLREAPKNLYTQSRGQIHDVLFTAHEARGTDDLTSTSVYGPGAAGKAITGKISAEVGTALHLEIEVLEDAAVAKSGGPKVMKQRVWAYYRAHPDGDNPRILWPAKPRIPPIKEAVDALEKEFPGGRFELTTGVSIVDYLRFQEKAKEQAMAVLQARQQQARAAREARASQPAEAPINPTPSPAGAAGKA